MKELDLTKAKWLKIWLTKVGGYSEYEVNNSETDICTLTRLCLKAGGVGLSKLVLAAFALGVLGFALYTLLSALSFFTFLLPEAWYAPAMFLEDSLVMLGFWISGSIVIGGLWTFVLGEWDVVPTYMKRKSKEAGAEESKTPSKTWIAVKEMYKSFKEKTCVKVKL